MFGHQEPVSLLFWKHPGINSVMHGISGFLECRNPTRPHTGHQEVITMDSALQLRISIFATDCRWSDVEFPIEQHPNIEHVYAFLVYASVLVSCFQH